MAAKVNVGFGSSFASVFFGGARQAMRAKSGIGGYLENAAADFMKRGYKSMPTLAGAGYGLYQGWKSGDRDPLSLATNAATMGLGAYALTRGAGYAVGHYGWNIGGGVGARVNQMRNRYSTLAARSVKKGG